LILPRSGARGTECLSRGTPLERRRFRRPLCRQHRRQTGARRGARYGAPARRHGACAFRHYGDGPEKQRLNAKLRRFAKMFISCRCSRKSGYANSSIWRTCMCCRNRAAPRISSCRRNSAACWRAANPCSSRPMREPKLFEVLSGTAILVPAGDSVAMAREIGILVAEGTHPALGDGRKLAHSFDREACLRNFARLSTGPAIKARDSAPRSPEPPRNPLPPIPYPWSANIPQPVPSNRAHRRARRKVVQPNKLLRQFQTPGSPHAAMRRALNRAFPSKVHLVLIGAQTASHQIHGSRRHVHDVMPE